MKIPSTAKKISRAISIDVPSVSKAGRKTNMNGTPKATKATRVAWMPVLRKGAPARPAAATEAKKKIGELLGPAGLEAYLTRAGGGAYLNDRIRAAPPAP